MSLSNTRTGSGMFAEEVEIAGHIIDSLILPKVLDEIAALGGRHDILDIKVGENRKDPSYARLKVEAESPELLEKILASITRHAALPVHARDCELVPADLDGAFPEGFYSTTYEDTAIRLAGRWLPVARRTKDGGILVHSDRKAA